jgi:hypothetical protein
MRSLLRCLPVALVLVLVLAGCADPCKPNLACAQSGSTCALAAPGLRCVTANDECLQCGADGGAQTIYSCTTQPDAGLAWNLQACPASK